MTIEMEQAAAWRSQTQRPAPTELAYKKPSDEIDKTGDGESANDEFKLFGDDGFTFLDFIDIINPLQHIPIVGTFYREWSGDTVDPGARVAGSTLFFGPIGTVGSVTNVVVEQSTGKDLGDHILALFEDETPPTATVSGPNDGSTETAAWSPVDGTAAGADPVTEWARAELAYRSAEAARLGIEVPERQYAAVTPPAFQRPQPAATAVTAEKAPVDQPMSLRAETPAAPKQAVPDANQVLAALGMAPPKSAAAPNLTTSFRAGLGGLGNPSQPNGADLERAREQLQQVQGEAQGQLFNAMAKRRTSEKIAARRNALNGAPATVKPRGAAAQDGGWFSKAMIGAYDRYHQGQSLGQPAMPKRLNVIN